MGYRFDGKVIIVTGAGSGIGRATAQKLHSLGALLALSDINPTTVVETNELCGGTHFTSHFDVGSSSAASEFISSVITHYGHIEHIFNCAGVNPTHYELTDTTDEYWDKLVNTNLKGAYNITRAVIPHLKAGASFINVSSNSGLTPSAGRAIYCATKYGIIGFSKCMALELGPRGIRTNIVAPGITDTPTNSCNLEGPASVASAVKKVAMGRMATPEEIANVVAFIFSDEASYMNGSVVEVNGGRAS